MNSLTQERLKQVLDYDPETGVFIWNTPTTRRIKTGDTAGRINKDGYIAIGLDYGLYLAHRLAWLYVHGRWPKEHMDHIDGDRTNNGIGNLREADYTVNARNKSRYHTNTTGVTGVGWDGYNKCYKSRIYVSGKTLCLYSGKNFLDAIAARKSAEAKLGFHPNHGRKSTATFNGG